jgi:hypothetical protein
MKARLRTVDDHGTTYTALMFVCPGCVAGAVAKGHDGYAGLHMLPVNSPQTSPSWDWDGNLDAPTLSPSILTDGAYGRCHSFLKGGVFEFLSDSTHPLAGQHVPMPDLPDWAAGEE